MARVALVEVSEAYADLFRRDELARLLRRELGTRGVVADFVSLLPPPGSRAGTSMASGALAVSLFPGPSVAALAEGVLSWLAAGDSREVKVTVDEESLELAAHTPEHRDTLVTWLLHHSETEGA